LGTGAGTGAATARLFAKNGYNVALIARGSASVTKLSEEITAAGGQATPFPVASYSHDDLTAVWSDIRARYPKGQYDIRAAVWNAGETVFKPFLSVTPEETKSCLDTSVAGAFAFARAAVLTFKENALDAETGKRGALIFTGATSSVRGNVMTSVFSAAKHAVRGLSQSLAKEFGKENIHVSHVIIDGVILTDRSKVYKNDPSWEQNADARLLPESVAKNYLYLVNQDRSAWTWELDLRPAHERW